MDKTPQNSLINFCPKFWNAIWDYIAIEAGHTGSIPVVEFKETKCI